MNKNVANNVKCTKGVDRIHLLLVKFAKWPEAIFIPNLELEHLPTPQ